MLSDLLAHGHDIRILPRPQGPNPLQCLTASVGYEQRLQEIYSWNGMKRGTSPFLVLQHTVLGEGRLDHAGVSYRLQPGQTMLVTVPQDHRYFLERGGHWEYFWAVLHGREALRLAREVLAVAGPVLQIGPQVDRLAATCLTLLTAPDLTAGQNSTLSYAAMTVLHDAVFGRPAAEAALPPAFARVVAHVEAHLSETLTIDRLASLAGLSRAHFVRRFTAAVGVAPSDYVAARRMERIERLLLATEMSVGDIAAATGFASGNYLAKAFRRHRGFSPLEFRATREGAQ